MKLISKIYFSQDSTNFSMSDNSKMFNISSKYFSIFNNKLPSIWAAHIARDFLTCYSCSHYSYMVRGNHLSFMNKTFSKTIMHRTRFWNRYLNENKESIRKNIFTCMLYVHNTMKLSRHEKVCLMRLFHVSTFQEQVFFITSWCHKLFILQKRVCKATNKLCLLTKKIQKRVSE